MNKQELIKKIAADAGLTQKQAAAALEATVNAIETTVADGKKVSLESVVRTVDEIERITGIDFYPALDDKTERRIEADADFSEW